MLDSLLTEVRERDHRFTVYRHEGETDFEEWLATHTTSIESRPLPPGGPAPFVAIEKDGEFAGAVGLESLESLLEPPIARPGEHDDVSEGYRVLFEVLDDTVFHAMDRRQLLAVSREIEDRAYRTGTGTLRVGFQTLSTFRSQVDVYRRLATTTELDVHIYGAADWSPPEIAGITYHSLGDDALERYWVLAFDGGTDETRACGLVAREEPDGYDGFWTDDPEVVRTILAELAGE